MIPRDHHGTDASGGAGLNCALHLRSRRIDHADQPDEDQVTVGAPRLRVV
jgi:hypothetical protein